MWSDFPHRSEEKWLSEHNTYISEANDNVEFDRDLNVVFKK